jgi:FdrA protein
VVSGFVVRKNQYYDSVFLMRVNKYLSDIGGVQQSAVLMGSERNKQLLADIGIQDTQIDAAQPNDLMVAVIAENPEIVNEVLRKLDDRLQSVAEHLPATRVHTLGEGLAQQPNANLAVISVPGEYAAPEAYKALDAGLNVFLFSDNVPIEDELKLKQMAAQRNLLVMGPDCGTSLIGGVGIGFANAVRRGPIGVIGASGTGLQEFTSQAHNAGFGISHAIGTGSRDLSDAVGGLTTLAALDALEADLETEVIALLSKPPGAKTLSLLLPRLGQCSKPVITCFLGIDKYPIGMDEPVSEARTLDDAVDLAIRRLAGGRIISADAEPQELGALVASEQSAMTQEQKYIRGIFAGGTFCFQAQQVMQDAGLVVYSNAPLDGMLRLTDPNRSVSHTLVDMGAEMFTHGRPHPMIDATLRRERILAEAQDPQVAVLLLDFILGYNASADPAGDLLEAIAEAQLIASQRGGFLSFVASVCGTDGDPQNRQQQIRSLKEAGLVVLPSSAQAAQFSWMLAASLEQREGQ